ncbi:MULTISPECIES: Xaa-Pro peptidase family protein [Bradyrhizobium]|uniref:Aminopeptidase P family protein n=1 Tax=Bradyrhizobium elkanii TaxID=29448 RepID=A0A4U6RI10_BRAEL|nr:MULTISPECIES: Xaa-Pro peptidase family protein [Bradyrhizobium]MTV19109.1 aminopeptidase P family protein [Bradyrhizobium sp. BR2003]TKV74067.1 aminopeptidase P family protein [Bradyrhizobium elkanii]
MAGNRQAFSTEEFRVRVRRVHAEMERQDIDLLLIHAPENIYYLTGYQTSGYFAYQVALVARGRDPELLVRFLERGNVNEYSWLDRAETWREGDNLIESTLRCAQSLGSHKTVGLEKQSWFLTAAMSEALSAGFAGARVVDGSRVVPQVRLIKSEAEIRYLRRASEIAEIEQRAALAAMRDGVLETQVAAAVFNVGVKAGCEYTGLPHHVMSGYRYDIGHANWLPKPIVRGELTLLELYGCVERYHATQMRTISVGPVSDEVRRAADIVIEAQDAALAAMRPGASAREIDALVRRPVRKIKPEYYNRTGYSTGIGFPPRTAEWDVLDFNEQEDWVIKEGMVFHMLAFACGFGISETVAVTPSGIERLTHSNQRELCVVT